MILGLLFHKLHCLASDSFCLFTLFRFVCRSLLQYLALNVWPKYCKCALSAAASTSVISNGLDKLAVCCDIFGNIASTYRAFDVQQLLSTKSRRSKFAKYHTRNCSIAQFRFDTILQR